MEMAGGVNEKTCAEKRFLYGDQTQPRAFSFPSFSSLRSDVPSFREYVPRSRICVIRETRILIIRI